MKKNQMKIKMGINNSKKFMKDNQVYHNNNIYRMIRGIMKINKMNKHSNKNKL